MQQKGFTLLELIVVVALAGIIVSAVLLNTTLIDPNKNFITLTNQTAKLIHHAHQEAKLSNNNYALSLTPKGYFFLQHQGGGWAPLKDKVLNETALPKHLKLALKIDKKLVEVLSKSAIKEGKLQPHILLLGSGEMSPFEWSFSDLDNDLEIILTGTYNGSISIEKKAL